LQAFSGRKLSAQAHEAMIYGVKPVLGGICHGASTHLPMHGLAVLGDGVF
jgi:hypothetical protein